MGKDVRGNSRVCPLPPGPLKDLNRHLRPRSILMAVSLTFILTTTSLAYSLWQPPLPPPPPPPPPQEDPGTPYGVITIDGDTNFSDTALLKGWPGNGSSENPYIIDGLHIDRGGEWGHCIMISNTRVSFTISNCNLTGANSTYYTLFAHHVGAGIHLQNVSNSELINNACNRNNGRGISISDSDTNIVANNTCNNNSAFGIVLERSDYNIVVNNTCNDNGGDGISLGHYWDGSDHNTLAYNTCTNNSVGISLGGSKHNTMANNTCNNNEEGFFIDKSNYNTLAHNTCTNNTCGIKIYDSDSNTVIGNTCNSNVRGEGGWGRGIGIYVMTDSNIVANNSCNNNDIGICFSGSSYNTVANNTCTNNNIGILLENERIHYVSENVMQWIGSHSNTVENNICNNNGIGIHLFGSSYNTVVDNTCDSNDIGIFLERALTYTSYNDQADWEESHANTVENNICNNNRVGIYLGYGCAYSTWVVDNTYLDNTEYDLYRELGASEDEPEVPMLTGFVGWMGFITVTLLSGGWVVGKRLVKEE